MCFRGTDAEKDFYSHHISVQLKLDAHDFETELPYLRTMLVLCKNERAEAGHGNRPELHTADRHSRVVEAHPPLA